MTALACLLIIAMVCYILGYAHGQLSGRLAMAQWTRERLDRLHDIAR